MSELVRRKGCLNTEFQTVIALLPKTGLILKSVQVMSRVCTNLYNGYDWIHSEKKKTSFNPAEIEEKNQGKNIPFGLKFISWIKMIRHS